MTWPSLLFGTPYDVGLNNPDECAIGFLQDLREQSSLRRFGLRSAHDMKPARKSRVANLEVPRGIRLVGCN